MIDRHRHHAMRLLGGVTLLACLAGCAETARPPDTSVALSVAVATPTRESSGSLPRSAPSSDITSVGVRVTDRNGQMLTSGTTEIAAGETATLTLSVPAGPGRRFIGRGYDGDGRVRLQGLTVADLSPGVPASLSITLSPVEIAVIPSTASVLVGTSQSFTATVTGLVDPSVRWTVNDVAGGSGAAGTISQTNPAVYTAPASAPSTPIIVKAASVSDPSVSGTATVTIMKADLFVDVRTGVDRSGCGGEASPCRSITQGLREATRGKTVQVAPGTYDDSVETFPIRLKDGVQVAGSAGAAVTIAGPGGGLPAVVAAESGTLSGFVLTGHPSSGAPVIVVEGGAATIKNNRLRNGSVGIRMTGGEPTISGNDLTAFTQSAIVARGDTAAHLDGNVLYENDVAVTVGESASPAIRGNTITHNRVGLLAQGGAGIAAYNQIRDNQFGLAVDGGRLNLGDGTPESPGQNVLSCNAQADLITDSALVARGNAWDHTPPTRGASAGDGVDIAESSAEAVDATAAALAPRPCSAGLARATLTVAKEGTGTVTSTPKGIECGGTCAAAFFAGTSVTLRATPASGWTFAGWTGGGCTGTGDCSFVLSSDTTVGARFEPIQRTLTIQMAGAGGGTVTSEPGGIVCPPACSFAYNEGTSVTLTPNPDGTSAFAGWEGGGCVGTGPCVVTLTADTTVTAQFVPVFVLAVSPEGSGTGRVASSPGGIDCAPPCEARYPAGTAVTLTAAEDPGSVFVGWGGSCSGIAPCTLTLGSDTSVTARFLLTYALVVQRDGDGSGTVTSEPAGISCGDTCETRYAEGTTITLKATPDPGSSLTTWSGAGCGGAGDCVFTITGDTVVTATFNLNIYTLSVTKNTHFADGRVRSDPSGIDCGFVCAAGFRYGTSVVLTVSLEDRSLFGGWVGGGCSGSGPCRLTVTTDTSVQAIFIPRLFLDRSDPASDLVLYGSIRPFDQTARLTPTV